MYSIIAQPHHAYRVGDFLMENLSEAKWTHFRASVAFVKKSGTQFIQAGLAKFAAKSLVNVSIGLDHRGSSVEGFSQLLDAINPNGKLWVYKNSSNTFHPKVYLFKNLSNADVVIGSGNMTKGGLFENAEIGVRLQLDLTKPSDIAFLKELEATLDIWSSAQEMRCLAVDAALISQLHAAGELPTELEASCEVRAANSAHTEKTPSPFNSATVQKAPSLSNASPASSGAPATTPPPPPAATSSGTSMTPILISTFAMTLQNTDVGVGQTTAGTSKRSPEIFIPIGAVDMQPEFWGWVSPFVPDFSKYKPDLLWRKRESNWISQKQSTNRRVPRPLDKLDWEHVKVNLTGHNGLLDVAVWFNPKKIDIRLRESSLRLAGDIDDILVISQAPQGANYDYEMEVVRKTDPGYASIDARLTQKVPGASSKKYGYF
jgi:HKD family nuclease